MTDKENLPGINVEDLAGWRLPTEKLVKAEPLPPVVIQTLYTWGAVKLALDVVAWQAARDRTGMESPNYALEAASPAALVQVAELLAFRVGLAAAGDRSPVGEGRERRACSEALSWVQDEIVRRLTPADDLANEPF